MKNLLALSLLLLGISACDSSVEELTNSSANLNQLLELHLNGDALWIVKDARVFREHGVRIAGTLENGVHWATVSSTKLWVNSLPLD